MDKGVRRDTEGLCDEGELEIMVDDRSYIREGG